MRLLLEVGGDHFQFQFNLLSTNKIISYRKQQQIRLESQRGPSKKKFFQCRYLSHSIKIPSHAQDQQHPHWTCAARLPGIHDVKIVSHTMGNGTASVAWSRGMYKPEKPTQGASARAGCPAPRRNPLPAVYSPEIKSFGPFPYTESYLLQRFWREGWICNKILQKLHGTNTVIGISSDLISVKLQATEIDFVP